MGNWDDLTPARRYHEETKHSYVSVRTSEHRLDWDNRPHPFKEYRGLEPVPLPPGLEPLLTLGAGVVRTRELPGGDVYHFRTYASAGALYPVEVYVVAGDLPELEAGVYHFHPRELVLRRLRRGDFRSFLGHEGRAAVLVLTGILWRTAWKYGARGYRHLFWDAGTMLANLLALAADERPVVRTGFVDERVNRLVGVDGRLETALALLPVGSGRTAGAGTSAEPEPIAAAVEPLSREEVSFPLAEELHAASVLTSPEEVDRYTGRATYGGDVVGTDLTAGEPLEEVIRRRGSARHFTRESISAPTLAAILAAAVAPYDADTPRVGELYLIANAVEGLEPGAYRYRASVGLDLVKAGDFRRIAGYLALEQVHAARAAATHFILGDLGATLAVRGNRGYRALQLEAGIVAGRLYLAAYARGLGATGLTFYDDDVARFLTGGTERQPLLCVAVGPARRARRPS